MPVTAFRHHHRGPPRLAPSACTPGWQSSVAGVAARDWTPGPRTPPGGAAPRPKAPLSQVARGQEFPLRVFAPSLPGRAGLRRLGGAGWGGARLGGTCSAASCGLPIPSRAAAPEALRFGENAPGSSSAMPAPRTSLGWCSVRRPCWASQTVANIPPSVQADAKGLQLSAKSVQG